MMKNIYFTFKCSIVIVFSQIYFLTLNYIFSGNLSQLSSDLGRSCRRHSINDDGTVLKRVASLTLDRVTLDSRVSRKISFTPQKLETHRFEKFEGQLQFLFLTQLNLINVKNQLLLPK